MKNFIKISLMSFIFISFISCNKEETFPDPKNDIIEEIAILKSKGIIAESEIIGDVVYVAYPDGLKMNFNISDNNNVKAYFESGREAMEFNFVSNLDSYELVDVKESSYFTNIVKRNPEHPGQNICECYEQDLGEFCDGVIGCAALISPLVHAVILGHCAIETHTTSCGD